MHEEIFKREDGSRVKIVAKILVDSWRAKAGFQYVTEVFTCEKGKRTWKRTYDQDCYKYRALSMEERVEFQDKSKLDFVSKSELCDVLENLWLKLSP
jgi:hypothetical protein